MTRDEVLKELRKRLPSSALFERSAKRVYVEVPAEAFRETGRYLFQELGARLNTASGIDARSHFEVLYHFTLDEINLILSLRVRLPKSNPEMDALTPVCEAANWVEREIHELLGIRYRGHPDLRKLLLPDEWPAEVYPLRRDYKEWDPKAIRDRGAS